MLIDSFRKKWGQIAGFAFFVSMMAVGYYYNLTFVQFGLIDAGTRLVGMSRQSVAGYMALLALMTCLTSIAFGLWMMKRGLSDKLLFKLRVAFLVLLVQILLTALAPGLRSQVGFALWIIAASLALGVGVPVTFSMTVDLVPVRSRGAAAALITAIAYFTAAVFSTSWTIERFSQQLLVLMAAGLVGLGVLAFGKLPFVQALALQHRQAEYGRGRFVRIDPSTGEARIQRRLIVLIFLMFGIFFVDSLGFLRLSETPVYFESAWQSPFLADRMMIGVVHVVGALIAGVLYSALNEKHLFLWIFGIFALTHMMYSFDARFFQESGTSIAMALLYSLAVSLYTVVNFAIWADVSTPRTISRNTALGVALSGWTATFLSTALALQWTQSGLSLVDHINIVDAVAMVFFLLVVVLIYFLGNGRPRNLGAGERSLR